MSRSADTEPDRRKRREFWLTLLLGGIFCAVGIGVGIGMSYLYRDAAAQIEQLPVLSASALRDSPLGREVLVEGRIGERNPVQFRSFVAYFGLEFRGWDTGKGRKSRPIWAEIARVTPPLLLELPDGLVQIVNSNYTFRTHTIGDEEGPVTWQDHEELTWDSGERVGTRRYSGYEVGHAVLALGQVAQGTEGKALKAAWLYNGTKADYIASYRDTARLLAWIGPVFMLTGLLFIGLAVWQRRRSEQTAPRRRRTTKKRGYIN